MTSAPHLRSMRTPARRRAFCAYLFPCWYTLDRRIYRGRLRFLLMRSYSTLPIRNSLRPEVLGGPSLLVASSHGSANAFARLGKICPPESRCLLYGEEDSAMTTGPCGPLWVLMVQDLSSSPVSANLRSSAPSSSLTMRAIALPVVKTDFSPDARLPDHRLKSGVIVALNLTTRCYLSCGGRSLSHRCA